MASRESSSKSRSGKPLHSVDLPVFVISVAAELAGMHPQTLRQYDRIGLVQPSRAPGKARRYSQRDVNRLQQIQQLSQEGVSLEGIRRIIELESLVEEQQEQIAALQRQVPARRLVSVLRLWCCIVSIASRLRRMIRSRSAKPAKPATLG